jgi:hypothetical protein
MTISTLPSVGTEWRGRGSVAFNIISFMFPNLKLDILFIFAANAVLK